MSQAKAATDHEEIGCWIESRKGRTSVLKDAEGSDGAGFLRVDFRHLDTLEDLAFLHHDTAAEDKESRFLESVRHQA